MELTFEVPGKPQGKGRPRAYAAGGHARMYTPDKTAVYENWIRMNYLEAHPGVRFAGPVELEVYAYFEVPRSYGKARAAACRANETRPTAKPDADNILKAVADALSGTAYADDSAVVAMSVEKRYGGTARLSISLRGEVL